MYTRSDTFRGPAYELGPIVTFDDTPLSAAQVAELNEQHAANARAFSEKCRREREARYAAQKSPQSGDTASFSSQAPQGNTESIPQKIARLERERAQLVRERAQFQERLGTGTQPATRSATPYEYASLQAEPSQERINQLLAMTPQGQGILADRAREAATSDQQDQERLTEIFAGMGARLGRAYSQDEIRQMMPLPKDRRR